MATYQYCVAENWGKGFITADDSRKLQPRSFPGDVWRIPANDQDANRWIAGVNGARKTLSEAQAIVDAEITQAQSDWDALPEEVKTDATNPGRPENITLVE